MINATFALLCPGGDVQLNVEEQLVYIKPLYINDATSRERNSEHQPIKSSFLVPIFVRFFQGPFHIILISLPIGMVLIMIVGIILIVITIRFFMHRYPAFQFNKLE